MPSSPDQLADDLQALLEGSVDASAFRRRHPIEHEAGPIGEILCLLEHYLSDADIRARDVRYAEMQESELKKLISLLRSGQIEKAGHVHFLGYSD